MVNLNFLSTLLGAPGLGLNPEELGPAPMSQIPQQPTNVMQQAAAPIDVRELARPLPTAQVTPEPPRQRRSLIDTIGRVSDVLARVGGAEALYQPTLDAYEDRDIMRDDRQRQIDLQGLERTLAEQRIAAGTDEATARGQARLGSAVRGLQAIQARGGDIATAWPILARQAGVPEENASQLGQIFAANPQAIGGFATMLGAGDAEFGVQPFYAQGPDGTLRAYQLGRNGEVRPIQLGDGESPIDPLEYVDVGDRTVGVGERTGQPRRVFRRGERPGAAEDRASRERIAAGRNASQERIAGMPARGRGNQPQGNPAAMAETVQGNLAELRDIYGQLDRMGAMVSPSNSTGANLVARIRASGAGQLAEGAVGTQAQALRDRVESIRPALMQSLANATGMSARQLDSNADVRLFMQTVTDPTRSLEANLAAIAGLERFLAANARGQQQQAPAATPRSPAPRRRVTPRGNSGGGWGRATVVGQ